jgi:Na+/proline symporter
MINHLSPSTTLIVIGIYFLFLMGISYFTARDADTESFFTANRKSPWLLVAIGMIGASLSGVTFISSPGLVGKGGTNMNFSYMQVVLGYLIGYFIIATVLMPIYYRLNLTTIYGYLHQRFGVYSYKIGAFYFLLSRLMGSSMRLLLVAMVLYNFVLKSFGISFFWTVALTIILIWIYTYRGGIKTIVYTDTIQTVCMLSAVILTIVAISNALNMNLTEMWAAIGDAGYRKMFYFEGGWSDPNNFFKQFISGALIAVVMTGLDQDMMQKNLTCKTLGDAQKNMFVFSGILVLANILFLTLGGLLWLYASSMGVEIPAKTDLLYPTIALQYLSPAIGIVFVVGLIAAAYSSADSALTSLTTSFCIDFLQFEKKERTDAQKKRTRLFVHIGFSLLLLCIILIFRSLNNDAIINEIFTIAGYTYGPLLGLFSFGLFTTRKINDPLVWVVCILSPIISFIVNVNSASLFNGFQFGFLILAFNGLLTFVGLWLISKKA